MQPSTDSSSDSELVGITLRIPWRNSLVDDAVRTAVFSDHTLRFSREGGFRPKEDLPISGSGRKASYLLRCPRQALQYLCADCFGTEEDERGAGLDWICGLHRSRLAVYPKNILVLRHVDVAMHAGKATSHIYQLFAVLPRMEVDFMKASVQFDSHSVLLCLECLCQRCIWMWQFRMQWDPGCVWYRRRAQANILWTFHDFACPRSSFTYKDPWSIPSAWELFAVASNIRREDPSFIQSTPALRLYSASAKRAPRWARIQGSSLPKDIRMPYRYSSLATAADLPTELHDIVLGFFTLGLCDGPNSVGFADHNCNDREDCARNHVDCSKQELYQVLQVCRRWAHLVRPLVFKRIILRGRGDLMQLLPMLNDPKRRIYAGYLLGELDIAEQLRTPWIHNVPLRLLPKLGLSVKNTTLKLQNTRPFPRNQIVSSIHGVLPRRSPRFSSGVRELKFSRVHFRTFEHLVRLIKELPSLLSLECTEVTWDAWSSQSGRIPWSTSFLARDDPLEEVSYSLKRCIDDRAVYLFPILLGYTREDIVDQSETAALWTIFSACPSVSGEPRRVQDRIGERAHVRDDSLYSSLMAVIGPIRCHLTPRAGIRQRRRVMHMVFDLSGSDWMDNSWPVIDMQLETLVALQSVVFACESREVLLQFLHIKLPFMSRLAHFPGLQFTYPGHDGWIQVPLNVGFEGVSEFPVAQLNREMDWKQYLSELTPGLRLQSSLRDLELVDVPLKSFEHLVRLVEVIPSLQTVKCQGVTWETLGAQTDVMPSQTSFIAWATDELVPRSVYYRMTGCSDNRSAFWLAMLLGLTTGDVLDQEDMNALYTVVSAWKINGSCSSARYKDEIGIGHIRIFLTPRTSTFQLRKVRFIAFVTWESARSDFDWAELDKQVQFMSALHVVLLVFRRPKRLLEYCKDVVPLMPYLSRSSRLKLALKVKEGAQDRLDDDNDEYVQVSLKGWVEKIGQTVKGKFAWTQFLKEDTDADRR
ncbi:hypothetical protein NM688_g8144 [Phlebia brevispora]|uniref:Uncharacterized protein n=1 Tax=Phlebia brevispora TaxID=194682 RepID=A0ACC1RX62_9APHY|nr:hypothetical protein NM688_g8144 [Phlebia brevispora]